ncbi:MAG TPA: LysM peptidoglycan-binding domain-containing protein [Gammaproteobacteria bacterium]|nr:LysM peptidoglycan-binding domain-containing protein [Gammaproteobacteria bacterium]
MSKFKSLALALALAVTSVFADQVVLKDGHPDRYVVVKGDTLWDISERFLDKPWLWPEIWYVNPQIENPHLIYPGDVINLVYVDGKPQLRVQRGKATIKLSPRVRAERLDKAIPTIPVDAIQQFLSRPLVVGEDELARAAYVVSSAGEHLITGAGDRIYVRGLKDEGYSRFNAFRPGSTYVDPETGEVLGFEAIYLGDGTVERYGDPSTLSLIRTTREVNIGDRVLPITREDVQPYFQPHAPKAGLQGTIISVLDGVSQIGQYQIVVLNRGAREGVDVGTVLAVYQAGETIRDQVSGRKKDIVKLPDERAGLVMVFRTFDKVSYALVMKATSALHVGDRVKNPDF